MKYCFVTFALLSICIHVFSQIEGHVLGEKGEFVEFATIFNLQQNKSCITDINGKFSISGFIGDTVEIRHLSYETRRFIIYQQGDSYRLSLKKNLINEVVISAKEAAKLFEASCRNTYARFSDFSITRGYCQYVRMNNHDSTQRIDLDMDVHHKKRKRFEKGRKIMPIIVQERVKQNDSTFDNEISPNISDFYIHINNINWVNISNNFNYYRTEDSLFIHLYFLSKKNVYDSAYNYEVKILKTDTCLSSVLMTNRNRFSVFNLINNFSNFTELFAVVANRSNYVKYNYENGLCFLSEFSHYFELYSSLESNNLISIHVKYKTYNKDATKLERRVGSRVSGNKLLPMKIKNNYSVQFWKNVDYFFLPWIDYNSILEIDANEI